MRQDGRGANGMLALLSRDWLGLPIALSVAGAGGWLVGLGAAWAVVLGAVVLAVGLLLSLGSVRHLVLIARASAAHPPPGRLVDVGGHRMHVLAEGESADGPTVVWMPGGHAPGDDFHQLHTLLAAQTRSVLVDRPGSGWSEVGPYPRTTATEAGELLAALEGAGERGPFVFVGHSFGGLLVANAARRRPELVAGLVLLDPTPPEVIAFGPPNPLLAGSRREHLLTALRHLFGAHRGSGRRTGPDCAAASIFKELSPAGMAKVGWQTVVYDGDLADLPLLLVTPRDLTGGEEVLDTAGDPAEAERVRRFYLRTRSRFLATSTSARRIYTPEGTSHNFPYEVPEFVVDVVWSLVRELGVGIRRLSD